MSDENSTLGTEALNIVASIRILNIDQWGLHWLLQFREFRCSSRSFRHDGLAMHYNGDKFGQQYCVTCISDEWYCST